MGNRGLIRFSHCSLVVCRRKHVGSVKDTVMGPLLELGHDVELTGS